MYIGIDQSFSETAITILFSPTNYKTYSFKGKGKTQTKKIEYLYRESSKLFTRMHKVFTDKMKQSPQDIHCFMEGGSFHSTGQLFSLGQVSGALIGSLAAVGIEVREIPPTTLKKFMAGNGNASKEYMMKQIYQKYGIRFRNDNKADSYALAVMAYRYYNQELFDYREEYEVILGLDEKKKKSKKVRYRRSSSEF